MTRITITATETIVYTKTYELAELEEYLAESVGITLEEVGLESFIEAIHDQAHTYNPDNPGFAEELERHGDVQGHVWKGTITNG